MAFNNVLPTPDLTDTEMDIIIEVFNNPVVHKYLKILALNDTKELLELSAIHSQDSEISKALAMIQGKLQLSETLLSLKRS